ncbi:PAS domain S-box protein [bacterium]|nr:PAS domain S-box protein [bacterium]
MKKNGKTKQQLSEEIEYLRRRIIELETGKIHTESTGQPLPEGRKLSGDSQDGVRTHPGDHKDIHAGITLDSACNGIPEGEGISGLREIIARPQEFHKKNRNPDTSRGIESPQYYSPYSLNSENEGLKWFLPDGVVTERDNNGNPVRVRGIMDISKLSEAEEVLRESEEQYRILFETSLDPIGITTQGTTVRDVNQAWLDLFGYTREDVREMNLGCLYLRDKDRQKYLDEIDRNGKVRDYEIKLLRKDGMVLDCLVSTTLRSAANGDGKIYQTIIRDITERKRLLDRLSVLNDCFLKFGTDPLDNINQLVETCGRLLGAECAFYHRIYDRNLCAWNSWHTPPELENIKKPLGHVLHDAIMNSERGLFVIRDVPESEYHFDDPELKKFGFKTYIARILKIGNGQIGALCVLYKKDYKPTNDDEWLMGVIASAIVAEEKRKLAEDALRKSEERLRQVIDLVPHYIFARDTKGKIVLANKAFSQVFGKSVEQVTGSHYYNLSPDNNGGEEMFKTDQETIRSGKPKYYPIQSITFPDGAVHILQTTKIPFTIADSGEPAILFISADITEQKKAEEALRTSEAHYRELIESINDVIFVIDTTGILTYINMLVEPVFGYLPSEVIGQHYTRFFLKEDLQKACRFFRKNLLGQHDTEEFRILDKSGKPRYIRASARILKNNKGTIIGLRGLMIDITERKKIEKKIRKSGYLDSSIFDIPLNPFTVTTHEGKILDISQSCLDLFGYTRQEIMNIDLKKTYVNPDDSKKLLHMLKMNGYVKDFPVNFRKKDGSVISCLLTANMLYINGDSLLGYLSFIREVPARKSFLI